MKPGWSTLCYRCRNGLPPPVNRTLADVKCGGCIGKSGYCRDTKTLRDKALKSKAKNKELK